jgi:hypothetical protein
MADRAAHLVDRVLPDVPIRQWVLSVPYRLRYQLAWDHALCRAVAGVMVHSICRVLADRARDVGVEGGRGGAVVVIQRFPPHGAQSAPRGPRIRRRAQLGRPLPRARAGRRLRRCSWRVDCSTESVG